MSGKVKANMVERKEETKLPNFKRFNINGYSKIINHSIKSGDFKKLLNAFVIS